MYKLNYSQYFEALKEDKLLGLKCSDCGSYTTPPKVCCENCAGMNLEMVQLSGKGEIKTYTVTRVAPQGLKAPYIVALVELQEGPWLMGNVVNVDPDEATIELIGKEVIVRHKVVTELDYTGGEGVVPAFYVQ
jgi:hypothetical protein